MLEVLDLLAVEVVGVLVLRVLMQLMLQEML